MLRIVHHSHVVACSSLFSFFLFSNPGLSSNLAFCCLCCSHFNIFYYCSSFGSYCAPRLPSIVVFEPTSSAVTWTLCYPPVPTRPALPSKLLLPDL